MHPSFSQDYQWIAINAISSEDFHRLPHNGKVKVKTRRTVSIVYTGSPDGYSPFFV